MKKKLIAATLMLFLCFLFSTIAYRHTADPLLLSTAITFGTTFYHFAMRLIIGALINARFHNRMDPTKKWFREKSFEPQLYRLIRVKAWKKWLPSLQPDSFLINSRPLPSIIQATCQAELVHEIIMALSFVPVIFSIWFGAFEVFFITSCIAFLLDGSFVILQRYNRPRLIRSMQKQADTITKSVL